MDEELNKLLAMPENAAVSERMDRLTEAAETTAAKTAADLERMDEARDLALAAENELAAEQRRVGAGPIVRVPDHGTVGYLAGPDKALGEVYGGQWTTEGKLAELEAQIVRRKKERERRADAVTASGKVGGAVSKTRRDVVEYLRNVVRTRGLVPLPVHEVAPTKTPVPSLINSRSELLAESKRVELAYEGEEADTAAAFAYLDRITTNRLVRHTPPKLRKELRGRWSPVTLEIGEYPIPGLGERIVTGFPLLARILGDQVRDVIRNDVAAFYYDNPHLLVIPPEERKAQLRRLRSEVLELEREIAANTWASAKDGDIIRFPDGLSPAAILGVGQ